MNYFSFLSLRNRYIPALLIIAIFSSLAHFNVNEIMSSIKNDGKLINISGRQRMLSQKLIIVSKDYISNPTVQTKQILIDTINLMKNSHSYLLKHSLSNSINNIYYNDKLDNDIKIYLEHFNKLLKSKSETSLIHLRKNSQEILIKLNKVVEMYELEDKRKLEELKNREKYIYILTIIALLLEAIFIFYPASKKIKRNTESLQEAIKDKKNELQKSIDIISSNVIYSRTDLKGNITYASDAFCNISGYSRDELIGKPHNIVRHPDVPSSAFETMWNNLKVDESWTGEVKNLKKEGGFYWVEAHISPEYDNKGNKIGYAAVRHNITDRKEIEELNANLNIKIEEEIKKNREKEQKLFDQEKRVQMTEMIGNIAHQWRQPLSLISTSASGMQIQKEYGMLSDDIFTENTDTIIKSTEKLSKTIDEFSKYIHMDDKKEFFLLQNSVDSTINIITTTLQNNNIKLTKDYDQTPIEINSIQSDISQVILNIIYNARDVLIQKDIKNSNINIVIKKEHNNAIITIEDNAGGIPEDIKSKIFDPYFTTKHQSQGTGMGLNMCQTIVSKQLNGELSVENTEIGAKFIIMLPLS